MSTPSSQKPQPPTPITPVRCPERDCHWGAHGIPDEYTEARAWHLAAHRAEEHGVPLTAEQVAWAQAKGYKLPEPQQDEREADRRVLAAAPANSDDWDDATWAAWFRAADRAHRAPLVVSRFDVAMEPAPEEEPVLTIGAVAEDGRPVALLLDPETRTKVARWLGTGDVDEMAASLARDGFGPDEIADMQNRAAPGCPNLTTRSGRARPCTKSAGHDGECAPEAGEPA